MSRYADWGFEDPNPWTAAEDLTNYVGRAMRAVSGNSIGPCSLTNQATTQALYGIGVLIVGGENSPGVQCRVVNTGRVRAVAGTGGVTAGQLVVPEYAASGLDRGRFIAVDESDLTSMDMGWGTADTTASEDGEFILILQRRRVPLDGTGA